MKDRPYFMTDERWYKFDFKRRVFVLTEEAPEKAKKSYDEFYSR